MLIHLGSLLSVAVASQLSLALEVQANPERDAHCSGHMLHPFYPLMRVHVAQQQQQLESDIKRALPHQQSARKLVSGSLTPDTTAVNST
eukprot:1727459-Amphidinium_carterae.1